MDGTPRLSLNGEPVYHYSALACFADCAVVPQESCVPLDRNLPMAVAGLIGCAVTTGMGAVLNTAKVRAGSSLVVWGVGGVGLSMIIGACLTGADRIIAVVRVVAKEAMGKEMGATDFIIAGPDTIEMIRELTEGRGADYVFETTGLTEVQELCLEATRPGGTVVLAGLAPMSSTTRLPGSLITREEKTVAGCYYGTANTARDFPLFAKLHLQKKIDLEKLISKTYPLDKINEAFEAMLSGTQARGVILF